MSSKAAALPDVKGDNEPSMEEILASIRKIIADDSLGTKKDEPPAKKPAAKKPEPEPEPEPLVEDDVLDLADIAVVTSAPQDVTVEPEPEPVEMTFEPVAVMVEPDPPKAPPVMAQPVMAMPQPVEVDMSERIISQQTGSMISAAFQSLARNTPMPAAGRSLEDVVVELVRPMLRDWIDAHLPGIVEKMVKAEIERVSRG